MFSIKNNAATGKGEMYNSNTAPNKVLKCKRKIIKLNKIIFISYKCYLFNIVYLNR